MMLSLFLYAALAFLADRCRAQTCWRNTTCNGPEDSAFPGPWESNIYAPASRSVGPESVLSLDANSTRNYTGSTTLSGNGSLAVLDFGGETGGIVHLDWTASGTGSLGLAFTEGKNWIGEWSDSSNGAFQGHEGALYANFTAGSGSYIMPDKSLRGGFRYLTLFLVGNTSVTISNLQVEIGFQPDWSNLRAYQGYFHSDDEMLNKIWYSGAYTLQTNAVPVHTGRWVPTLHDGWANNGTLGPGDTIIVDGAKRDRAVWPGDMGIAVPSGFVSIGGDLADVKNALQVMYNYQNADGSFPEAGPPLLQQDSDTYHMWTMIGTYNYVLFTNDTAFLESNWADYMRAMEYIYGLVGESGLLNVTGIRDWARWQQGFNNSEANMILYHTLQTGASLAGWISDDTNLADTYNDRADSLRDAIIQYCWDDSYGAFKDNATDTDLHPQDANSMAVLFNVTSASGSRSSNISENLLNNWTPIGAEAPELPNNISPFISSFEIQAHFTAGRADRALELIRRSWGWYLNNENGTGNTVIEGYLTNGTFGYRGSRGYSYDDSYVSHAHGWSSGPTSALTGFVLGLRVTGPAGSTWSLKPQVGDLNNVKGGFSTSLGKFQAQWSKGNGTFEVEVTTPEGTTGDVILPALGEKGVVKVNGEQVNRSTAEVGLAMQVQGGKYSFAMS